MPETMAMRVGSKEGLGQYGYGYLDLLNDTGATRVPWRAHLSGGTGAWGDPCWEALADPTEDFLIFPFVATGFRIDDTLDQTRWVQDVVFITPLAVPLSRPQVGTAAAEPLQVALEEVLGELRRQAGLPVGDLARMLGVSRRQFYNWLALENQPDRPQEERVRGAARLVGRLYEHFTDARLVRAVLLATSDHGTVFGALGDGNLAEAESAIDTVLSSGVESRETVAPSHRTDANRERVLLELSHLRDSARRGDD